MDNRRWDTGAILAGGILNITPPKSLCPPDTVLVDVDEEDLSDGTLRAGLEAGGLSASMYYGVWKIWRTAAGFSGQLMQYRSVTDSFTDRPLDEALEKALEWAGGCYG
jgi:hypothetical protein